MVEPCLPVAQEIGLEEVLLLNAVNGYLSVTGVADLDLLVPFFLAAYFSFSFEGSLPP